MGRTFQDFAVDTAVGGDSARALEKMENGAAVPGYFKRRKSLVSFDMLYPVHLLRNSEGKKIDKKNELVPITELPAINGQIISFTGQNAGGKSTTMEALIAAIYLAQSGLPVFGSKLSLNVKKIIGMVFLERGSRSTLQLLLEKYKSLLVSLDKCDRNGIVLFLDQVGTGTQEVGGLGFAKSYCKNFGRRECSVVFCTRITDWRKMQKTSSNAECFQFNLQHQISRGIGLGGIDKLMKKIGLDSRAKLRDCFKRLSGCR